MRIFSKFSRNAPRRTLDAHFEEYLFEKAKRVSTNYLRDHRSVLLSVMQDLEIEASESLELHPSAIEHWMEKKLKKVRPSTVGAYLFALDLFMEWLIKKDVIKTNTARMVEGPRYRRPFRKVVGSKEMVRILIDECPDESLKFILYAGFHCGLRKQEICCAKKTWFDYERQLVHVTRDVNFDTKDGEDRSIPLTSAFEEFLSTYHPKGEYMLPNAHSHAGIRYRYDFRVKYNNYIKAKSIEHGFPRITIHDMRRTFASIIASSGQISIYKLSRWMGDDVKVVQRCYAHLQPHKGELNAVFGLIVVFLGMHIFGHRACHAYVHAVRFMAHLSTFIIRTD